MDILNINTGLNLLVSSTKKFKTVSVGMLIRRPLDRQEVTINAIIPGILKRGCEKYPSVKELYRQTELMYGAVFDAQILKKGEQQILQFFIEVLNKDNLVNEAIEFLYELTIRPLTHDGEFEASYIEGEKENLKKVIGSRINDKKEYALLRCIEEMFSGEPFGLYGDGYACDIDGMNNIYAHYQNILRTSPIEFIVIGDVDAASVHSKLANNFNIERGEIIDLDTESVTRTEKEPHEITEQLEVSQGKLCIGLSTGINPVSDDFYKLIVANEILGGGANSRMFAKIREKEQLCYYINSSVYRFKTALMLQAGIDESNYERCVSLIRDEIKSITEAGVSERELADAIKSLRKRYVAIDDYPSQYMDFYLSQYMLNDNLTIEQAIEKISAVTVEDITGCRMYTDTIYFLKGGKENYDKIQ